MCSKAVFQVSQTSSAGVEKERIGYFLGSQLRERLLSSADKDSREGGMIPPLDNVADLIQQSSRPLQIRFVNNYKQRYHMFCVLAAVGEFRISFRISAASQVSLLLPRRFEISSLNRS